MKRLRITERFVRYQGVSLASFFVDLGVIAVLILAFDVNYLVATGIGFLSSVVFAFFINRRWSFRKWVNTWRIGIALSVGFTTLCVVLFVTYLGVTYIHVPYLEARVAAALIAAIVSYIGDSIFTFEIEPFDRPPFDSARP